MSVAMEAIHDFYFKDNFFTSGVAGACRKGNSTRTIPTARAAVGQDAVFVSLRGIPPYLYRPFFADFGPLDMSCCVHFARRLCELLRVVTGFDVHVSPASAAAAGTFANGTNSGTAAPAHRKRDGRGQPVSAPSYSPSSASAVSTVSPGCPPATTLPVVVCASLDAQERVNMACLVGAFCVLCLGWSAVATWYRGFADIYPGFLAYRDASQGVSNYPLSLIDVWAGLEQGVALGLVNVHTFDIPAFLEGKQHDYSWVVPRRFLAMSSPQDDKSARTAEVFARRLRPLGVRLVVRLNDNLYNPSPLLRLGIRHVDLPYADGSVPCDAMLLRFLQAVEEHFGESVAPVSLQEWWSVPSSTTATARAGSASKKASSGGASHRRRALQPCSFMHSGTCRGMPEAWTAAPPSAPPSHARRLDSVHANGTQGHGTCTLAPGDKGAVAVHCLAGLGRTGTMLAVYMMRHYGFTARAVIGWMRLCRPGSITGIQQQYLDAMERRLRPPPHMLAALQLNSAAKLYSAASGERQFELSSRRTRSSSLSATSSTSALPNAAAAAQATRGRGGAAATGRNQLDASPQPPLGNATTGCMRSTAAVTAFQTHGSVVADARPATATSIVGGHIRHGDSGRTNAMAARPASDVTSDIGTFTDLATWTDLAGLRGAQQQRQQLLMRRFSNSSSATLSLSTIQAGGEALDAVARMPVLGDDSPQNRSAAMASLKRGSAAAAASDHKAYMHPSPRVDDCKYASTYFVAMERAGELPHVYPWSTTSTARGGPRASHGGGPRPATANTFCETAPRGVRHLSYPRSSECSIGSDASRRKETRTAPASADSCLRPRKGPTSALQRRRPYTAAAAVSVGPQLHAKRHPTHYERGGAADHSETDTHASGDTPPCSDLSEKTQQSPRPRQTATRTRVRWDDKGACRANLDNARAGDTAAADLCVDVRLQTSHPPSAPMRSSLLWSNGGVTELEVGPRSPLVLSRSPLAIPATSLPMWGRPVLRT
ncbi:putative tyrosine phosphatase [Leishmania major strain Friedlin]|uniref:Putative tyrosine phosphatase n=1 Tax=Leishmania major TaxID=5664 RepID=Q4QHY2_LEIMA|nr:putative tyrosine phosphatase [Leishmania major strain Friedlin]CAG9569657.1 tyrosine_phosphatase_-__putative [Leishmania major strain Friedlin]CAJ02504.1 putative tyrosine phosphatase [Leishmania major strain Friedlin]|eukprot:XP_001681216.1 putative tyrosine phosphatase [Leishmania major strain Friedlin]